VVLPIADQWAVPQYADPMAAQSPEGLLAASRLADPTVVPPTVAHTAEQPSAEHTEEQPSLLVAPIDHIMALVRLQRVSRLGDCGCGGGFDLLLQPALLPPSTLLLPAGLVE
jgi:hypothetical protein